MALLAGEQDNDVAEDEQFGILCFLSSAPNSMLIVYKLWIVGVFFF